MANSKKPRKRFDFNQRMIRHANRLSRSSFILAIPGLAEVHWIKNNQIQFTGKINKTDFELTFFRPRPWSMVAGVACRDQLGQNYLKYEYIGLRNQFSMLRDKAFNDFIFQEMERILRDVNTDHVLTPFTLLSPERHEFEEEEIKRILRWRKVEEELKTYPELLKLQNSALDALRAVDPLTHSDKRTWQILRENGVQDWADFRLKGLNHISTFKGIGEKRQLTLAKDYADSVGDIPSLLEYEAYIAKQNERDELVKQGFTALLGR